MELCHREESGHSTYRLQGNAYMCIHSLIFKLFIFCVKPGTLLPSWKCLKLFFIFFALVVLIAGWGKNDKAQKKLYCCVFVIGYIALWRLQEKNVQTLNYGQTVDYECTVHYSNMFYTKWRKKTSWTWYLKTNLTTIQVASYWGFFIAKCCNIKKWLSPHSDVLL